MFPAQLHGDGKCLHHQRQQFEPKLYTSHQPSSMLVERSRFGPPKADQLEEEVGSRPFDRRRLVAERERFFGEP